jgi:hypothetical protein
MNYKVLVASTINRIALAALAVNRKAYAAGSA